MPYIPHTPHDVHEMLQTIQVGSIEQLFDEIPASLKNVNLNQIPSGLSEMQLNRLARERAQLDRYTLSFLGAGAYEHHIPAAVWDIAARGEFMTAYTPYQPEASQGSLQLIYEYQTMMARLMDMDVSNASLYDGATAAAEAALMAVRLSKKKEARHIFMPQSLHPHYQQTLKSILSQQHIELILLPFNLTTGQTDLTALHQLNHEQAAALLIPQPNVFGVLEPVDALTEFARAHGLLSIAVVNPLAMALLKPPGQWGENGVDIACGEGQPLGIPLSSGGPYYGFLTCKKQHVRQMPGRVVGKTTDQSGTPGFVLTLQAREQHIRRAKATSNICTNQGLMVTASTIFMSLLGKEGLYRAAVSSHARTRYLHEALSRVHDIVLPFKNPFFHEIVVQFKTGKACVVLAHLAEQGILAGWPLAECYPQLQNSILMCATETKTEHDIDVFIHHLQSILAKATPCPV